MLYRSKITPGIPCLFVMPDQCSQVTPIITVLINICHAAPETALQILGVVFEQHHHRSPAQTRKRRPCVVVYLRVQRFARHDGQAVPGLDGESGHSQTYSREDVDDDLLVYGGYLAGARRAAAEDKVAAQ